MKNIEFSGQTDRGNNPSRPINEDSLWLPSGSAVTAEAVARYGLLFIVADGMGGHDAGEKASAIAAETIPQVYYDSQDPEPNPKIRLNQAIKAAHEAIKAEAARLGRERIGTTVVAAAIQADSSLWLGWVGDSRAYRMRQGKLQQLTEDHSVLWPEIKANTIRWEELHHHPQRSKLTNSLNAQRLVVEVDHAEFKLQPGDKILLCSDGLTSEVHDKQIGKILKTHSPTKSVELLTKAAKEEKHWLRDGQRVPSTGGEDNVTAIVIEIPGAKPLVQLPVPGMWLGAAVGLVVCLVLLVGGFLWFGRTPVSTAANNDDPTPEPAALIARLGTELAQTSVPPETPLGEMATPAPTGEMTAAQNQVPQATSTLVLTPTPATWPTPTPTSAPGALLLMEASPVATPTLEAVVAPLAANTILLVEPGEEQVFGMGTNQITFKWRYGTSCELPPSLGFELRIWRTGESKLGAMDAVQDQSNIRCGNGGERTFTIGDLRAAPGVDGATSGRFMWDVALVQIDPYDDAFLQQAVTASFELGTVGGGGGGSSSGPKIGDTENN